MLSASNGSEHFMSLSKDQEKKSQHVDNSPDNSTFVFMRAEPIQSKLDISNKSLALHPHKPYAAKQIIFGLLATGCRYIPLCHSLSTEISTLSCCRSQYLLANSSISEPSPEPNSQLMKWRNPSKMKAGRK